MATSTDTLTRLESGQIKTIGGDNIVMTGDFESAGLHATGNALIGGSLTVVGDITAGSTTDIVIADNFLELNNGQVNVADMAGGLTVNVKSLAARVNCAPGAPNNFVFQSAVTSPTAFPRFMGAAYNCNALTAGDVIEFAGLSDAENNGTVVVHGFSQANGTPAATGGVGVYVEIENIGGTLKQAPWAQTNFADNTTDSGTLSEGLSLGVFCISNGVIEDAGNAAIPVGAFATAFDSPATLATIDYVVAGSDSFQQAYNVGATVTTTAAKPIAFTLLQDNAGFSVQGTAAGDGQVSIGGTTAVDSITMAGSGTASSWSSTGANLSLSTVTTGNLSLTSVADLDLSAGATFELDAVDGDIDFTDTSHIKVNANAAAAKALDIEVSNADVGGTAALNLLADNTISAGSVAFDVNASGAITMDGGAASNLSVAGVNTNLTLGVAGAGTSQLIASSAGTGANAIRLNASAGGVDVDAETGLTLNSKLSSNLTLGATSAADQTLTIAVSNGGAGEGILVGMGDSVAIDSGVGAVTIAGAAGASLTATTGTLTVNSTAGALTQTAALTSVWGMSANTASAQTLSIEAGNLNVDPANVGHLYLKSYDGDVTVEAEEGVVLLKTGKLGNGAAGVKSQARVMMLSAAGAVIYADNTSIDGNDAVGVMCDDSGANIGDPCVMLMQQGTIAEIQMKAGVACAALDRLYLDVDGLCVTDSTVASGSTVVLIGVAVNAIGVGAKGLCVWNGRAIALIP